MCICKHRRADTRHAGIPLSGPGRVGLLAKKLRSRRIDSRSTTSDPSLSFEMMECMRGGMVRRGDLAAAIRESERGRGVGKLSMSVVGVCVCVCV